MDTNEPSFDVRQYRFRTRRQKKRAQRADVEKQLIRLSINVIALNHRERNLPQTPLNEPYQHGWERSYVLAAGVTDIEKHAFYETLLAKLNSTQLSPTASFIIKIRRNKRKIYEVRMQPLKSYNSFEWHRVRLTDAERAFFYRREQWDAQSCCFKVCYIFSEPWRFQLVVKPHIITQVKVPDNMLEQEIAALDNFIRNRHLQPVITRLTDGSGNYRGWCYRKKAKLTAPFYNQPLHAILAACNEDATDEQMNRPIINRSTDLPTP